MKQAFEANVFGRAIWRLMGLVAGVAVALGVAAQDFPSRPVTIVVGYAPGGSNDIMARNVQAKLSDRLGVPVIVENRPGADGMIGSGYVAKAAPDGYTLLLTWDAHVVNSIVRKDIAYDIFKDFTPVTLLGRFPLVLVASNDLPVDDVKQLIALAKREPGKLSFASVGAASSTRLHAENLVRLAGINAFHVPYKGAGPSVVAVMRGEVSFSFLSYAAIRGQLDAGKIKALAVTGANRLPELPKVATMAESGYPDSQGYSWIGIFAPAGTPQAVVSRLNKEFRAALADAEVEKKVSASGVEIIGSPPSDLDRYVRAEYDKWSRFVERTNLTFAQ